MNQSTEKVAVTLSHNQSVNGVEHVAGATRKADIQAALAAAPKTAADSAEKGGAR